MAPRTLTVGHGNIHNGTEAIRAAVAMDCDVFGFNEAGRRSSAIGRLRGYRMHVAKPVMSRTKRGRNVSGDCTTIVRDRLPFLGEMQQQVSQQVDAYEKIAPDRWFNVACFRWGKVPVAHVNIHPNAGPGDVYYTDGPHRVKREYAESMAWLDAILTLYRSMDYALIIGGDFNFRDLVSDPAHSPYPVLKKHGITYRTAHIDVLGWSKHFTPARFDVIPKEQFRSDHPALRVALEVK